MEFPRIGWYCTSLFPNAITQLGPLHLHFGGASFLGKLTTCPAVFKRKIPGNFTFQIWGFFGFPEFSKFGDLMELDPGICFREQKNWHLDTLCWSLGEWAMWDKPWHSTRTHDWMRVANKNAILTRVK